MEATTTYSLIMAFLAPIIRDGMASVSNGFTESDPQFHIKCNSSFADKECKRSSVIFDTGASMHVMNNGRYLTHTTDNPQVRKSGANDGVVALSTSADGADGANHARPGGTGWTSGGWPFGSIRRC